MEVDNNGDGKKVQTFTHVDVEEMLMAIYGEIKGLDTNDNEYDSILALWNSELKPVKAAKEIKSQAEEKANEVEWYNKAFDYWESETNCPITDGKVYSIVQHSATKYMTALSRNGMIF